MLFLLLDRRNKRLYLYEWKYETNQGQVEIKVNDSYIYELDSVFSEPFNLCSCTHPAITPFIYGKILPSFQTTN